MRILRYVWHAFAGHPRDQVIWGNVHEGASCSCGYRWTIADYQV
jgi:hypothetical protein